MSANIELKNPIGLEYTVKAWTGSVKSKSTALTSDEMCVVGGGTLALSLNVSIFASAAPKASSNACCFDTATSVSFLCHLVGLWLLLFGHLALKCPNLPQLKHLTPPQLLPLLDTLDAVAGGE